MTNHAVTVQAPGATNFNPEAPSDNPLFTNYYAQNNFIGAGVAGEIVDSQRCSIINGANNLISGKYNAHVIGDYMGLTGYTDIEDNSFNVGCHNGMVVYGDIRSKRNLIAEEDIIAFSSSDKRLKDDITLIDEPLSKIMSLDAIEFNWNDNQSTYTGHDIGLVAQQVEEVAPEIVETRKDGYKAIKYEKVNALLVGAIQEQQKKIEFLEKRLESLERRSSHS